MAVEQSAAAELIADIPLEEGDEVVAGRRAVAGIGDPGRKCARFRRPVSPMPATASATQLRLAMAIHPAS